MAVSLTLIDESYNANPASMRAALADAGKRLTLQGADAALPCWATCLSWAYTPAKLHAGLVEAGGSRWCGQGVCLRAGYGGHVG
jgi:hypothetical protein